MQGPHQRRLRQMRRDPMHLVPRARLLRRSRERTFGAPARAPSSTVRRMAPRPVRVVGFTR